MNDIFNPRHAQPAQSYRERIESIARESNVPVNVLLAMGERAGGASPSDLVTIAQEVAQDLSPRLRDGGDIQQIIREVAGDQADSFLTRAREIGEELYPDQMAAARRARERQDAERRATEPGVVGNLARSFGGGLTEGIGSMVEGAGVLADMPASLVRGDENYQPGLLARMGRTGGNALRDRANDLRGGMSQEARRAIEQSTPGGDITRPETWTMGESPSISGYTLLAFDVLGSFAPVVIAGIVGRGVGGMAAGGAQSAGAGAEQGRELVREAFEERDEQGRSLLERESPYFRELLAAGMDEDEAFETTQNAVTRMSALFTAPVGALGGAATSAILRGVAPGGVGATGGPLRRALTRGTAAAAEEGFQEAASPPWARRPRFWLK